MALGTSLLNCCTFTLAHFHNKLIVLQPISNSYFYSLDDLSEDLEVPEFHVLNAHIGLFSLTPFSRYEKLNMNQELLFVDLSDCKILHEML